MRSIYLIILLISFSVSASEETEGIIIGALKTFDTLTSDMENGEICNDGPDLVQRFCQDPVQVVCDPANRIDRPAINARALDRQAQAESQLRARVPARPTPEDISVFLVRQNILAWEEAGGSAVLQGIFNRVRQDVHEETSNSVMLPRSIRQNLSQKVASVTLKTPQNLGQNMSMMEYQNACGRDGTGTNLFYNPLDNSVTICPQAIYLAITSYPELSRSDAIERFLFMALAHEIGHSTHSLGPSRDVSYDLTNACYGGDQRNTPTAVTNELKADFWATSGLVARLRQRSTQNRGTQIRDWISRGLYGQMFCQHTEGSARGHAPGHQRLRMIARLSEMRHLLECEPRFRGLDQTCDHGFDHADARRPRPSTPRRRRR